jgi:hypothetical protein
MTRRENMRFSNVLLMVLTPIGLAIGLREAWHLAGGLVVLMAAQVLALVIIAVALVRTMRRERAAESPPAPSGKEQA